MHDRDDAAAVSGGGADKVSLQRLPLDLREKLGARAKARRVSLGMSVLYVAQALKRSGPAIVAWERCLPASPRRDEADWEKVLQVSPGWLRDKLGDASPIPTATVSEIQIAEESVTNEIKAISRWLSTPQLFRRSINVDELSPQAKRAAEIFALRYGALGEEVSTLQAIGDRFQLTRERVRQIVDACLSRAADVRFHTPCFDRLASEAAPLLPRDLGSLEKELKAHLGQNQSIEGAERFAREVLGRSIVRLTRHPADMVAPRKMVAVAAHGHDPRVVRATWEVSTKMIRSAGAAQILFVAGAVSEIVGRWVSVPEAERACRAAGDFEWLVKEDGWFSMGIGPESRLRNTVQKVMAVANRNVDAAEIMSAFNNSRRTNYSPDKARPYAIDPPVAVVVEVLRREPSLVNLQHDDFRYADSIDKQAARNEHLSEAEKEIYRVLASKGGVAPRHVLMNELVDTEILKFITLQVCLHSSPVVCRLDWGIYALRGYSIDPAAFTKAFAAADEAVRGNHSRRLLAVDSSGWVNLDLYFSQYSATTRVWEVPSALARVMSVGDYWVEDCARPCTYRIPSGGSRRLNGFVRILLDRGFAPGCKLRLWLHPEHRQIRIERLSDEAVED